jgi:hypothetical protein
VIRLLREHLIEQTKGTLGVPLGSIDFRQSDGGNRCLNTWLENGIATNGLGCIGQVQPLLHHTGQQIARYTEPSTGTLAVQGIRFSEPQDLVR